jgi:hypothetical protein
MTRLFPVLLSLLFLTSCSGSDQANEATPKNSTTKTAKKEKASTISTTGYTGLRPEFIKSIPGSIDGCGEFFTFDSCKLSDEKYIFLSDMGDLAIIRIKGKDIQLKKSTIESKQLNAISSVDVYYAVGYRVVLRKKEVKVQDELTTYSGTLQITSKKIKTTFKVRGEGGC